MDARLFELKSQYGTLIKIPIPVGDASSTEVKDFYFRRMSVGEWLKYATSSTDTMAMRALVEKLLVFTEFEDALWATVEKKGPLLRVILDAINARSEFNNNDKLSEYYTASLNLATSNLAALFHVIIDAFPSYSIRQLMAMDVEELIQASAFAETKLSRPYYTEYILMQDQSMEQYQQEFGVKLESPEEYTYELHINLKQKLAGMDVQPTETGSKEHFIDANGNAVFADRQEYQREKALQRENLARRRAGLPPVKAAEFFSQYQGEGMAPTAEQTEDVTVSDLEKAAAAASERQLKMVLAKEKELQMKGIKKPKTFNWQEDAKTDMTWGKD